MTSITTRAQQIFLFLCFILASYWSQAQNTNYQSTVKKCYTGATGSVTNSSGTLVGYTRFTAGDIPPDHRVVDVIVEIVWSKTNDGSCRYSGVIGADLSHVGFTLNSPHNGGIILAASTNTANIISPTTTSSFTGVANVVSDTIVFKQGAASLLPATTPVLGRDTFTTNNEPLSRYYGVNPIGKWSVGGIDDPPSMGPPLCIHSYCITLVTCDTSMLSAVCKSFTTVGIEASGTHSLDFSDLDSLSDVSCRVKDISFFPSTVSCADVGTTMPITMTIRDYLDSVATCVSQVLIEDSVPPTILGGLPNTFDTLYLAANGLDTFWADSLIIMDNCGPVTKGVRFLSSPNYSPFVVFNCVSGLQRIEAIATDASGLSSKTFLLLEIVDTTAPIAICGRHTAYLTTDSSGKVTVPAILLDGGTVDFCGSKLGYWIGRKFGSPPVFYCNDLGVNTLKLFVADFRGNVDSCNSAELVVLDTIAPTVICRNDTIYLDAAGQKNVHVTSLDDGSIDVCGIDSIDINGAASINYNCSHLNAIQSAVLHVYDASGNVDSCTSWVVVRDTFAPLANCSNDTVYLDANGSRTINAVDLNSNSSDVCTGTDLLFEVNGANTVLFDCADALTNPNVVPLTVLDTFGNASTCTAFVTVLDTTPPVAICTNPTIFLNNSGVATLTPALISAGISDNCAVIDSGINNLGTSIITYDCSTINTTQNVTLVVADNVGNTHTCTAVVTVADSTAPTPQCYSQITASLDATGVVIFSPSTIDSNSTDNCTLVSYQIDSASSISYTCSDLGTQVATLTIQDSVGNIATCTTQVTIEDNIAPTVSCQTTTVVLNSLGTATLVPNDVLLFPTTSDNCGIMNTAFITGSSLTFDCDSIGQHLVDVLVSDAFGNVVSCQTTVTVEDTAVPNVSCRPVPFVALLDANGIGVVTPMDIDNGSSDLCQLDTLLVNGVDSLFFDCNNTGTQQVTLSVYDHSGNRNSCTADVIIRDGNVPTAVCRDTVLYLGATGIVTALPSDIDGGSGDNCNFTLSINGSSSRNFSCPQVGKNQVKLKVEDAFGNKSYCQAFITIKDTLAPVANCITPNSITVYLDTSCFASVPARAFNSGSMDNCNLPNNAYFINNHHSATFNASHLPTNPNIVVLKVTDLGNNSDTCQTTVIVLDTVAPKVFCKADTVQLSTSGNVTVFPNQVLARVSDNCGGASTFMINNSPSVNFDCSNIGSNTVLLTAIDSSGNSSNGCQATVFVEDLIAPNASCRPTTTLMLNAATSLGILTPSTIDLNSTDNCGNLSFSLDRDTFTCADILANPHTVQLLVKDAKGNLDSCTTQLIIEDGVDPIAACQTTTVYLNGGNVNVTPGSVLIPPTGDNCGTTTSAFALYGSNIMYTCDSIGSHRVKVIVTDISGNTASCVTTIIVEDSIPPVANCITSPFTVQLDSSGNGFVFPQDIDNGSFDFCGISDWLVNGVDSFRFTCANTSTPVVVTLSVLDSKGNSADCKADLIIKDPIDPIARCHDTTLYLNTSGSVVVKPAMLDAGSTDNCSFTTSINNQSSMQFNCNQVGVNTVQLMIEDVSGNSNQCPANVTIVDTIKPTAICVGPSMLKVYLDNSCFASIPASSINNGSVDNCNSNLSYTINGRTNATFNITNIKPNPTPITLVVQDVSGNQDVCHTSVFVVDTISPILSCKPDTLQLTGINTVLDPLMVFAGALDNCSMPTLTINRQPSLILTCNNLGNTTVMLTATDVSGNQDYCSTTVYLEDIVPPVAKCNSNATIYLDSSSNTALLTTGIVDNGSTDNCNIISYGISQDLFYCSDVLTNPNPVRLFVVDQSGNQDSCTIQVEVLDTISPVAVCQNDTLYYTGAPVPLPATNLNGGSSDNCGIQSYSLSQGIFDCPNIGKTNVLMTVTDLSGNTNVCSASVLLLDTIAIAVAGPTQVLCNNVDSTNLGAMSVANNLIGTWSNNTGASIDDPNNPATRVSNLSVGDNIFYWNISSAGCARLSVDSVTITVIFNSPDSAQAGIDTAYCADTVITLNALVPMVSTGRWLQSASQANAGVIIVDSSAANTSIKGLRAGNIYQFIWQLSNGLCGSHDNDTVLITVDETPSDLADAGPDITCSPDSVNLAANSSLFGIAHWTTPSTASIADSSAANTLVSDFEGDTTLFVWSFSNGICVDYSVDSMYVILDDVRPIAVWDSFNLVADRAAKKVDVIANDFLPPYWNITISQPIAIGRIISLNNGSFELDINDAKFNQYFIYEICNSKCPVICDTALVTIAIQPPGDCYIPTAFTPNGDGKNDFFIIPCLSNTDAKAALYVFNRWGNLVYETDNYVNDWDGTHKEQPLPDGTYFYILQIEDKKPQNGSIEIKQ